MTRICVYRKGFTHVVRGVQCEMKAVNLGEAEKLLADGWTKDLSELKPEEEKPKKRGRPAKAE